jgi:hypothetical protein
MDPRLFVPVLLLVLFIVPAAQATTACPAGASTVSAYNKLVILNSDGDAKGYKLVNEPFIIRAIRVSKDKEESRISGRSVKIYFYTTESKKTLVDTGTTNSQGEYSYTPEEVGDYFIEAAGKGVKLPIYMRYNTNTLGAECGNGICESEKMENNENCPEDCTICGDAKCEGLEDKENCPEDCIICGDGVCDVTEYSRTECSCIEDCIICGDGDCDSLHGEDDEDSGVYCPEDCEEGTGSSGGEDNGDGDEDFLKKYWWIIAAIVGGAVAIFVIKRRRGDEYYDEEEDEGDEDEEEEEEEREKPKPKKKKKSPVKDNDEIEDIIQELMDSGISEKRIHGRLKDFGLEEDEASELIKKAKK